MSGQKGQNGPLMLKCSQCKKQRDEHGSAKKGELVWTGRTKVVTWHRRMQVQLKCLVCKHVGWYRHRDALKKPIWGRSNKG